MATMQGDVLAADGPAPGTDMVLMPVGSETTHSGTIRSWTASGSGLVVSSQVAMPADVVEELDGRRVWASARLERSGSLAVFQAVAQAHRDDELALTGVVLLANEARRSAVRARTRRPAHLHADDFDGDAHTVDISRTGVRVESGSALPDPHQEVEVSVALQDGVEIHARGEVLRVDREAGEAVIQFVDMGPADSAAVDRAVFTELSGSGQQAGRG